MANTGEISILYSDVTKIKMETKPCQVTPKCVMNTQFPTGFFHLNS